MFIDAVPAIDTLGTDARGSALASFLSFLERRLRVRIVRDVRTIPGEDISLAEPLRLAHLLREKGIIKSYYRSRSAPDEPRMHSWSAICNNPTRHQTGGSSWTNDADALYAALAEALERYIWFMKEDYFVDRTWASVAEIEKKGEYIAPTRFAGYTDAQRAREPRRRIPDDAKFTWIQGLSLVRNAPVYLPAQVVSGVRSEYYSLGPQEPLIRPPITIGLATWPTQVGARCAGANEVLEREAYMVMWLNQLSLPRYSSDSLRALDAEVGKLLDTCAKYRLKMHVIKMLTDAPTHTVAVVLEDESDIVPRFTIGIRGHRSLSYAILKATSEAFRARRGQRLWTGDGNVWDPATPASSIGHRDRLYYWGCPANAPRLAFLIAGDVIEAKRAPWDTDTEEAHLERIVRWFRETGLECVAVSLGTSPTNPTPLHVEMAVAPELQWTYLTEQTQTFGGNRWREVPRLFGFTPRSEPFADEPHPFS